MQLIQMILLKNWIALYSNYLAILFNGLSTLLKQLSDDGFFPVINVSYVNEQLSGWIVELRSMMTKKEGCVNLPLHLDFQ